MQKPVYYYSAHCTWDESKQMSVHICTHSSTFSVLHKCITMLYVLGITIMSSIAMYLHGRMSSHSGLTMEK